MGPSFCIFDPTTACDDVDRRTPLAHIRLSAYARIVDQTAIIVVGRCVYVEANGVIYQDESDALGSSRIEVFSAGVPTGISH